MGAKNIPNFYDFPKSSGGITCDNNFYLLSDGNISIRRGSDDAAATNIRPRIDLTDDIDGSPACISFYVEDNQQGKTAGIRPQVDAGSGLMPVSVGSGIFYGRLNSSSGVPNSASAYGVIPWERSLNPDDVHYAHDPSDSAHNTHIKVLLTGWYTIAYHVTAYKSANNTYATTVIRCRKNNTTTFEGSSSLAAVLLSGHGNSASWTGSVYLIAGDVISIDCRELATSANDVAVLGNYCSLRIKYEGPSL